MSWPKAWYFEVDSNGNPVLNPDGTKRIERAFRVLSYDAATDALKVQNRVIAGRVYEEAEWGLPVSQVVMMNIEAHELVEGALALRVPGMADGYRPDEKASRWEKYLENLSGVKLP